MERAQEIFSKLDTDNGGDITEAEFIKVCLEELPAPGVICSNPPLELETVPRL